MRSNAVLGRYLCPTMPFRIKRIYDRPTRTDGYRVLVDRLWPRGIRKDDARLNEWNKVLPPSNALRKDYHDGRLDFRTFSAAYRKELQDHPEELDRMHELAEGRTVTLLYASANAKENHAIVLLDVLQRK